MAQSDEHPEISGVTSEERHALETVYRAINERNLALLDDVMAVDWLDIPTAPGQQPGLAGFKPVVQALIGAFPDLKMTVAEIIGAPGRAAVRLTVTGTHKGEWFGVTPTNRPFEFSMHEFHRIENGKLTRTWHVEDWFSWLLQVGAWPGP